MRCPTLPNAYGAMIQYQRRPWLCSDVWLALGNVMAATAPEVARALADVLEREALPYAIGGALALGFYALPRATADVDLNVFLPPAAIDQVLRALRLGGVRVDDEAQAGRQAADEGQFRGYVGNMRIDVFVPAFAYYASLSERRRQVSLLGRPAWILGAEDLIVLKMMFFRRKDLADVEAILSEQPALDRPYVRRTLIELVGAADPRIATLASIEHDVDAPREE
jgi:hypothetical protein